MCAPGMEQNPKGGATNAKSVRVATIVILKLIYS